MQTGILAHGMTHFFVVQVEEAKVTNIKKELFLKNKYKGSIQQERTSSFVFPSRSRKSFEVQSIQEV